MRPVCTVSYETTSVSFRRRLVVQAGRVRFIESTVRRYDTIRWIELYTRREQALCQRALSSNRSVSRNAYSLITVFLQPLSIRLDSFLLISRALENEIYFFFHARSVTRVEEELHVSDRLVKDKR